MNEPKRSLKLPIFLMIGPALGFILSMVIYIVIGLAFADDVAATTRAVFNVVLFLSATVSMLSFIPCLIIGIILLDRRRHPKTEASPVPADNEPRNWKDLE